MKVNKRGVALPQPLCSVYASVTNGGTDCTLASDGVAATRKYRNGSVARMGLRVLINVDKRTDSILHISTYTQQHTHTIIIYNYSNDILYHLRTFKNDE